MMYGMMGWSMALGTLLVVLVIAALAKYLFVSK